MIINSISDLKEFDGSMELATLLDNEIKGQRYILTKVDNRIILMCKENTVEDVEGLDKIIYYLARNIYETMCIVDDYIWFKDEEVLAKYFPNKFVTYRLEIKKVKYKNYIYENVEKGDIIIIGGDIKEDVEWAENNSLGLSTGFIVMSKNENTIIVKGDKEEREISYESVWGIYKNVSDYVFWLDSEK